MSYLSAVKRSSLKKERARKIKENEGSFPASETHKISMSKNSWYTVKEICIIDQITPGDFFENLIHGFMHWYVKESRRLKFSSDFRWNQLTQESDVSTVLFEAFLKMKMESNIINKYVLDVETVPGIEGFSGWSQPINIEIDKNIIAVLDKSIRKKHKTNIPNISDEIEKAITIYAKQIENEIRKSTINI